MNGLPYYKRYPRDFIEGTIGMRFELKAAYGLVLDLIYMQGGELPDDARYISGLLGCSVRAWNRLRAELISLGKITAEGGFISNFRADKELETLAKLQDKQRENRSRPNKIKEMQSPRFDHTEPEISERDKSLSEAKQARKRGSRLPDDWRLPRDWGVWAMDQGMAESGVRAEAEKFRDYWQSKAGAGATKRDWLATWRNWVRQAMERKPARHATQDQKLDAWGIGDAQPVRLEPRTWDRDPAESAGAADMPGVLAPPEGAEPKGSVSFGDPDAGWVGDLLPPLRLVSGGAL